MQPPGPHTYAMYLRMIVGYYTSHSRLVAIRYYTITTNTVRTVSLQVPLSSIMRKRWPSGLGGRPAGDRTVDGSSPTSVKTFLFGTLAIPFTPLCQFLSDETVKAVGTLYLVSMPGEVKHPTRLHWNV